MVDFSGGLVAGMATLAALHVSRRDGIGRRLRCLTVRHRDLEAFVPSDLALDGWIRA